MKFIDEVKIWVKSGDGGNGAATFRREKFVPRGGPDGGNGGDGGHVFFEVDPNLNTLHHFRGKRKYKAQSGQPGSGHGSFGKNGEHLSLKVPLGTIVREEETGIEICDLDQLHSKELILRGGRGGLGNLHFKSSVNQTPTQFTEGKEGTERNLILEMKLLADISIVGLPNAGKSTLISVISSAKPKIADYPFTTLIPNLGVVSLGEKTLVVADVPGLIEKASEGKGLGHQFLKHIERSRILLHLIDISEVLENFELLDHYLTIRNEIEIFNPEVLNKPEIVCLTKTETRDQNEVKSFIDFLSSQIQKQVLPISSVGRENISELKTILFDITKFVKENEENSNDLQ